MRERASQSSDVAKYGVTQGSNQEITLGVPLYPIVLVFYKKLVYKKLGLQRPKF